MSESTERRFTLANAKDLFLKFWNPTLEVDVNSLETTRQDLLRKFLYLWRFKIVVIFLNIIGSLIYLIYGNGVVTFVVSLFWPLLIPLYFYTWFRSLHKALSTNSSLSFISFFISFSIHCIISVFWALGVLWGTVGWIPAAQTVNNGVFYAIVMFALSVIFTLYVAGAVFLIIQVHSLYRNSGGSVTAARNEMATSAATAVVNQQFNQQSTPKY